MVRLTIDEMVTTADLVMVGVVRRSRSHWIAGRIYTDVEVQTQTVVRDRFGAGTTVTVRTPGGVVGDVGQRVEGAPVLEAGRRYVLFLRRGRDGTYETIGFSQGVLPVREASTPGTSAIVLPAQTDGMLLIDSTRSRPEGTVTIPRSGIALESLLTALRNIR